MIPDAFIYLFAVVVNGLASILPVAQTLPPEVSGWVDLLRNGLSLIGWILPFDTIMQLVTIVFFIEAIVVGFDIVVWVYNKFRGSG